MNAVRNRSILQANYNIGDRWVDNWGDRKIKWAKL